MSSNKIFGTDGIRGKANTYPMTAELALLVGKAVAEVFIKRSKLQNRKSKIVIGKDTRLSGYMIESALQAGICSMGADALIIGPMPTPAVAHLTKSLSADAGIMISASHNPAEDNGIKIFGPDGYKLADDVEEEIEKLVLSNQIKNDHINGKHIGKAYRVEEAYGRYIEFAKATINSESLKGFKLVIDCANGAAYKIAPKIFYELGAEVIVLNNTPDGLNINQNCGATHTDIICKAVKRYNADVGISLDGDADRIMMCDETGEVLNGDHMLAILSDSYMRSTEIKWNNKVAITVMSNLGLKRFLEKSGISYIETKVGDRYVIEAMKESDISLGGEQSGHLILRKYVTTGDGIITGLHILKMLKQEAKKLSSLRKKIIMYPQTLINVKVKVKKEIDQLRANKEIKRYTEKMGNDGRILVRYSGTENLCRVMVEAKSEKMAILIASKIAKSIKNEIGV